MPELPEVEIVRQSLEKKVKDKVIQKVLVKNRNLRFKIDSKFKRHLYKKKIKKIPIANPKSPTLFTIKAFIAAALADGFLYQKPINKYEHSPTPSHPKNNCKKLSAVTSTSIEKVNNDKYDIKRGL